MLDEVTATRIRSGAEAKTGRRGEPAAVGPDRSTPEVRAEHTRRRDDYRLFRKHAAAVFKTPVGDEGHDRMSLRSGYHVSMTEERERAAGAADAVVEVFYGPRTLPHLADLKSEATRAHWRAPIETGAALLYSQGVDGVVTAFLYPAQADGCLAAEDAILLGRYTDLSPLTGRGTLEMHWRAFRAYAECTSLDGEPTLLDRLMVRWLRFTRPRVVDNRRQPIAAATAALQVLGGGVALAIAAVLLGVR